jgi:uncharacterized membrane protein
MNKHTTRSYWFKRRRYGYGWTPVTWQGWLTVVLSIAAILLGAVFLLKDTPRNTFSEEVFLFLIFLIVVTAALVVISLVKGPRPRWRWGRKPADNPDEDF